MKIQNIWNNTLTFNSKSIQPWEILELPEKELKRINHIDISFLKEEKKEKKEKKEEKK